MRRGLKAVPPLLAALAFATAAPATRASDSDTAASTFAVRTIYMLVGNRYADLWRSLHPVHQRAVGGRTRYVQCELSAPFVGRATTVEALSVWDERASIAGLGRTRTKAVSIRIELAGVGRTETITHTVHVIDVHGAWRWVLPPARYASYRRGLCT